MCCFYQIFKISTPWRNAEVWAMQQQFYNNNFIYSRPIAGIRAKIEHETTYLQTSKWHVKNIHVKYHTDHCA